MNIVESIKNRPYLFGGVLIGGIILVLMLRASSGGEMEGSVYAYGSDVGTGDALQSMQLQVNRDIALAGINAQTVADTNASALEAARLDYEYKNNAANLAAGIEHATINATLQQLTHKDTLQAQTEQARIQGDVDLASINANSAIQQQNILANALVQQSAQQAATTQAYIAANKKECGLFGKIFGC